MKKEQERKAAERRRIIEERCGKPKNVEDANEGEYICSRPPPPFSKHFSRLHSSFSGGEGGDRWKLFHLTPLPSRFCFGRFFQNSIQTFFYSSQYLEVSHFLYESIRHNKIFPLGFVRPPKKKPKNHFISLLFFFCTIFKFFVIELIETCFNERRKEVEKVQVNLTLPDKQINQKLSV